MARNIKIEMRQETLTDQHGQASMAAAGADVNKAVQPLATPPQC
jgi:hypothetical protein